MSMRYVVLDDEINIAMRHTHTGGHKKKKKKGISYWQLCIEKDVIERSVLVRGLVDDLGEAATVNLEPVPLPNVSTSTLAPLHLHTI